MTGSSSSRAVTLLDRIQVRDQVRHFLRIVEPRPPNACLSHAAEHLRTVAPQRRDDGDFGVLRGLAGQLPGSELAARMTASALPVAEHLFTVRDTSARIDQLPHP